MYTTPSIGCTEPVCQVAVESAERKRLGVSSLLAPLSPGFITRPTKSRTGSSIALNSLRPTSNVYSSRCSRLRCFTLPLRRTIISFSYVAAVQTTQS